MMKFQKSFLFIHKSCNFGEYSTQKDNEIIMAVIDISMEEHGKVITGRRGHVLSSNFESNKIPISHVPKIMYKHET